MLSILVLNIANSHFLFWLTSPGMEHKEHWRAISKLSQYEMKSIELVSLQLVACETHCEQYLKHNFYDTHKS